MLFLVSIISNANFALNSFGKVVKIIESLLFWLTFIVGAIGEECSTIHAVGTYVTGMESFLFLSQLAVILVCCVIHTKFTEWHKDK